MPREEKNALRLIVREFKTIDDLELELKPLTVLIGPPASGKSNVLEALALLGLAGKLARLQQEYGNINVFCQVEPSPENLARLSEPLDFFPLRDYREPALIRLVDGDQVVAQLQAEMKGGSLIASYGPSLGGSAQLVLAGVNALCRLRGQQGAHSPGSQAVGIIKLSLTSDMLEARLYGYERYGVESRLAALLQCSSNCIDRPRNILAETAVNIAKTILSSPKALRWLNEWLREDLGSRIEARILRRGEIVFFSGEVDIPPKLLSDTVLRMLYYVLALYTSARYARMYKLRGRMPVLLEEPEARAFPYSFELLSRALRDTLDSGVYVVATTHNGMLLSKLLDTAKPEEIAVYYLYTDEEGYTRSMKVDIEKLAERLMLPEDLLLMKPSEVWKELAEQENPS